MVVFIGPSNIGDALLCLPAVRAVMKNHPQARGVLLLGPRAFEAVDGLPDGLETWRLDRPKTPWDWWRAMAPVRALRPVRVVDFRRSATGVLAAPWLAAGWRNTLVALRPQAHAGHAAEEYAALAGVAVAREKLTPADFGLLVPPEALDLVRERLGELVDQPLVVLQLGASHDPKRYPLAHWLKLSQMLSQKGFAVAWAGQAGEDERPRPVPPGQADFLNTTTFAELAALLSLARVVISNDSGPMHLAAALGVPVLGLFGQTSAARYGPFAPWGLGLQSTSECSPCHVAVCRFGEPFCLKEISPEEVLERALDLVAQASPPV